MYTEGHTALRKNFGRTRLRALVSFGYAVSPSENSKNVFPKRTCPSESNTLFDGIPKNYMFVLIHSHIVSEMNTMRFFCIGEVGAGQKNIVWCSLRRRLRM